MRWKGQSAKEDQWVKEADTTDNKPKKLKVRLQTTVMICASADAAKVLKSYGSWILLFTSRHSKYNTIEQVTPRPSWLPDYIPPDKLTPGEHPLYTNVDFDVDSNYIASPTKPGDSQIKDEHTPPPTPRTLTNC